MHAAPVQFVSPRLSLELRPTPTPAILSQVNFLIVKVTSLEEAQPRLENLWWLLHKPQGALNLVSVFPSLDANAEVDANTLARFALFSNENGFQLSTSFEDLLRSQDIEWQGYLILDDLAFQYLIGAGSSSLSNTAEQPFSARASMIIQWYRFCRQAFKAAWQESKESPLEQSLDSRHISFGPATPEALNIWQQILLDTPSRRCIFPGLDNQLNH